MLKNVSWLVVGRVVSDLLAFVFYIALARTFGESGMGDYAFAFAVALLLATLVDFGFGPLITRDLARAPSATPGYAGRIIPIQLGLATIAAVGLTILVVTAGYSSRLDALLYLAFVGTALQSFATSLGACLEAIEEMRKRALQEIVMKAVSTSSGLVLIALDASLPLVVASHVLGATACVAIALYWVGRAFGPVAFAADWNFAKAKLATAFPFLGVAALYLLYTRVDVMMLHHIVGDVETGRYAAAMRLTTTPLIVAFLIGVAIYPRMSRVDPGVDSEQRGLFLAALKWLGVMGTLGTVLLVAAGDELLVVLLGPGFVEAGPLMPWMAILFFVGFTRVPYERLLYANGRERTQLYIEGGALTMNVVLNLLLIPQHGALGAVWASIASQGFVLGALHVAGTRLVEARYTTRALQLLAAGACGLVAALTLEPLAPWPVTAVVAPTVALAAALVLGVISTDDRKLLSAGAGRWE